MALNDKGKQTAAYSKMDPGDRGEREMNLSDRKSKLVSFAETAFLYLLSLAVIYCTLLFWSRIDAFGLFSKPSYVWRSNPFLTMPYLIALVLGMAVTPLVWEKTVRSIDLREMGFAVPRSFAKEMMWAAGFFFAFVAYTCVLLSKQIELLSLSPYIILSLSIRWLIVAFGEEVLYRGIIQRRFSNLCGRYCGLILASLVFAFIGHFRAPLADNLMLRLPFGLTLGYLYLRSQSLLFPIGMHWGFNVVFAT
jgi:membrane protease YdiL (CAAX protease family)